MCIISKYIYYNMSCVCVEQCEEHAENNVWLVHKTGFTSAVRLPENNDAGLLSSESCLMKLNRCNLCVQVKKCDLHQV